MGRPVVDSNILIDYLLGHAQAAEALNQHLDAAISVITWIEVMSGGPPEQEAATRAFLNRFFVLPVTLAVATEAARLRRRRRIKLPDAIIWASARVEGGTLLTRNTKDFTAQDPDVETPYQL
jgi:hypothetical protein